ncbi:phage tail assembly chaperone [Camelimonas lactis]|uniref:Putative phage protein (TIGR02216 family) n=1 Tax=Camelimonas lactis TaxID=659006 RepID=A0A4R2GX52_9HYPH|nr:phage tail assembly chaperone [Camelimonas lactis]TCO14113.1 putative phage protein (TIGR02216 family) [Camelimonas lactis]
MAFGLGRLGLAPEAFWAMTPRELAAAMRGTGETGPTPDAPARADFAGLTAAFPD